MRTRRRRKRSTTSAWGKPKRLSRPVIVLGGWIDPGFSSEGIANFVRKTTEDTAVIPIAFFGSSSFDDSANKLVKALEDELPSVETNETVSAKLGANHLAIIRSGRTSLQLSISALTVYIV